MIMQFVCYKTKWIFVDYASWHSVKIEKRKKVAYITLEKITSGESREGISIPRNCALVYAFTYMNNMEHWGSGIPRIIRRCREFGLDEPELLEIGGSFRINLYRFRDKTKVGKNRIKQKNVQKKYG